MDWIKENIIGFISMKNDEASVLNAHPQAHQRPSMAQEHG